jgi:hypothetical protein
MNLTSTLNHLKHFNHFYSLHKSMPVSPSIIGKLYEEKCKKVVSETFDTPVALVGGANDGGVDLKWMKTTGTGCETGVNFIGQCKFRDGKRIQPDVVRSLEGSLSAHSPNTVGVLLTNRRPSIESLKRLNDSVYPMIYLNIKEGEFCKHIYEVLLNSKIKRLIPSINILECRTADSGVFFKLKFN